MKTWFLALAVVLLALSPALAEETGTAFVEGTNSNEGTVYVQPGQNTMVAMSATDINNVVCDEGVWDGEGKVDNRKSVIKFDKVSPTEIAVGFKWRRQDGGKVEYDKMDSDLHLYCGGERYVVIARPTPIRSVTVHLSPGRNSNAEAAFKGVPTEELVVSLGTMLYGGKIGKPLRDKKITSRKVDLFADIDLWLLREAEAPGFVFYDFEARYTGEGEINLDADDLLKKMGEKDKNVAVASTRWQVSAADKDTFHIFLAKATGRVRNVVGN